MKNHLILTSFLVLLSIAAFSQPKKVKKWLNNQKQQQEADFPEPLVNPYPANSLGDKLQMVFESQAQSFCGIQRADSRLYIPQEIVAGYSDNKLRNIGVYEMPLSATNLMFLSLTDQDITKINNNSLVESEYINAKRIVGIKNQLVNFGEVHPSAIPGFPSLYYQKSCGSYFQTSVGTQLTAPVAELEASLKAETEKSTSITTISGKFFSPLYLMFSENSARSVYAHMLLWDVYFEDFSQNNTTNLLVDNGKYISEMDATLINIATNSDKSLEMNARLSAGISAGIFSATGDLQSGLNQKSTFSLKDFKTYIHKLSDGTLKYAVSELPRIDAINKQLQNSILFKPQPSFDGYLTHLLPTKISRVLTGIPSSLCKRESWFVTEAGFDQDIWVTKPVVKSIPRRETNSSIPDCFCTVTGFVKKSAIDDAINTLGIIDLNLTLNHTDSIEGRVLVLNVNEPTLKVTDSPKILPLDQQTINAGLQEIKTSQSVSYNFPIQFVIDDTGVEVDDPLVITNVQIQYIDTAQSTLGLNIEGITPTNTTVTMDLKTVAQPVEYVEKGILTIPMKIKFSVKLKEGGFTQLVTNLINIEVPNLVEPTEVVSIIEDSTIEQPKIEEEEDNE